MGYQRRFGVLGSQNLPVKSNFQKHRGLDAITGKAIFDISEWMLIRLLEAMAGRRLAMLCKAATARKVLGYAWENGIALGQSAVYGIDTDRHFAAAVDAVLLVAPSSGTPGAETPMSMVTWGRGACQASSALRMGYSFADVRGLPSLEAPLWRRAAEMAVRHQA